LITQATQPPPNRSRWSVRTMARRMGVSPASVRRIWAANEIKPHLTRTFKLSRDPNFEAKFWDVIGLYLTPPYKALVLCCDEKSQCQALERTQPRLPLGVGHMTRGDRRTARIHHGRSGENRPVRQACRRGWSVRWFHRRLTDDPIKIVAPGAERASGACIQRARFPRGPLEANAQAGKTVDTGWSPPHRVRFRFPQLESSSAKMALAGACDCVTQLKPRLRQYVQSLQGKIWSAKVYARKPL
jgi:hypothetical protein